MTRKPKPFFCETRRDCTACAAPNDVIRLYPARTYFATGQTIAFTEPQDEAEWAVNTPPPE